MTIYDGKKINRKNLKKIICRIIYSMIIAVFIGIIIYANRYGFSTKSRIQKQLERTYGVSVDSITITERSFGTDRGKESYDYFDFGGDKETFNCFYNDKEGIIRGTYENYEITSLSYPYNKYASQMVDDLRKVVTSVDSDLNFAVIVKVSSYEEVPIEYGNSYEEFQSYNHFDGVRLWLFTNEEVTEEEKKEILSALTDEDFPYAVNIYTISDALIDDLNTSGLIQYYKEYDEIASHFQMFDFNIDDIATERTDYTYRVSSN